VWTRGCRLVAGGAIGDGDLDQGNRDPVDELVVMLA
jgi:hypothetical protein